MKGTTKRQIKNGLRWGGGLAVFLLAMLPLVDGLRRTVWAGYAHQPMEPVGWLELGFAAALLASTASVWVHYILGCMVFGAVKGTALIATGGIGGIGGPLQTAELLVFILGTILLLVTIVLRPTTFFDRIMLTLFVVSVGWRADKGLFEPSPSLFVGLMFLLLSWCVDYWKRRHTGVSGSASLLHS
jgi:hypothetical protein